MKKTKLILLLLFPFLLNAQITFDFSKRTDIDQIELQNSIKPVENGGFAIFNIENINTFRYKVEIEGKKIDYVTQIPSELQAIFRLSEESTTEDVQSSLIGNGEVSAAKEDMSAVLKQTKEELNAKKKLVVPAANAAAHADTIKNLEKFEKAMKELEEVCAEFRKYAVKVANVKFNRMLLISISKGKYKNHNELLGKMPTIESEGTMRKNYLLFVDYYYRAEAIYGKAKSLAAGTPNKEATIARIEKAEELIEDGYEKINEENFLKLIEDVIVLNRNLKSPEHFTVVSPPIQMDGDYVEIEVSITPTQMNDLMPFEQASNFKLQIPGKGGWKADFSVGPTVSFTPGAHDDFYSLNDTSGMSLIVKENNDNFIRPGIAAMIHAYKRDNSKPGAFGFMFGVGAGFNSIDDADLSLYAGGTKILGKYQKVMLSVGISAHRVDRLRSNFDTETLVPTISDVNEITRKVFRPSLFLSLSYNLTNRVEVN